jgi:hypothetical protein
LFNILENSFATSSAFLDSNLIIKVNLVLRSTIVPIALLWFFPITKSPSQCPISFLSSICFGLLSMLPWFMILVPPPRLDL